jgi:hypothetical protein
VFACGSPARPAMAADHDDDVRHRDDRADDDEHRQHGFDQLRRDVEGDRHNKDGHGEPFRVGLPVTRIRHDRRRFAMFTVVHACGFIS